MKLKMKGFPCLLLCSLALSGSGFASTYQYPHKYVNKHAHKCKVNYKHDYKGDYKGDYKAEAFVPRTAEKARDHFEIIGALGAAKLNAGNSQLGITSSETDTLVQTNANNWTSYAGQLGAGYVHYFRDAQQYSDHVQWFPSIEPQLNFYPLISNSIDGNVWRFDSPDFIQLTYDIPVRSFRLMVDGALTVASYKQLSLYAKGGIGNAWNRIGYSDKDNDPSAPCQDQRLNLNTKTNSHFAWEAGAGLTFAVNERVGISVEYLYADLGKVRTSGSGDVGTISLPIIAPAQFKLKTQTALIGLHIAL